MIIQFNAHRGNALISRLIRLMSPKYNHISIQINGYVYEAHIGCGVRKTKVSKWNDSTVVKTISFETKYGKEVIKFLDKQVGKGYDVFGIFSFLWWFFKPSKERWYCSELSQVALYKACGKKSRDLDYQQRVSPYQFWRNLELVV